MTLHFASSIQTTLGAQAIAAFQSYKFPKPNSYKFKVTNKRRNKWFIYNDLEKALAESGGSGKILQPVLQASIVNQVSESNAPLDIDAGQSLTSTAYSSPSLPVLTFKPVNKMVISGGKQIKGNFKKLHFTLRSANTDYFTLMMSKAWVFLRNQKKIEIIIHGKNPADLNNIILQNPHLHIDSILCAMPPHSGVIIQPQIHDKSLHWTIGPPLRVQKGPPDQRYCEYEKPTDITPKFMEARKRVTEDIEDGKLRGPRLKGKALRKQIRDEKYGEPGDKSVRVTYTRPQVQKKRQQAQNGDGWHIYSPGEITKKRKILLGWRAGREMQALRERLEETKPDRTRARSKAKPKHLNFTADHENHKDRGHRSYKMS